MTQTGLIPKRLAGTIILIYNISLSIYYSGGGAKMRYILGIWITLALLVIVVPLPYLIQQAFAIYNTYGNRGRTHNTYDNIVQSEELQVLL
jgi:hypothetical protein